MSYNQNSSYGQAMLANLYNQVWVLGNVHLVMNSSDTDEGNYQHLQDLFPVDNDGKVRFYTSLASAYAATESNNNDVIILDGNSTHTLSSMLTVSNNRVHFIGLDYLLGIHRPYGQSTKVSIGITTAATDIAAVKVTGTRCSFRGIKFISDNTVAEGLYTFVDGWEYTYLEDVEVYKSTDMDVTGAAEFVCNGDSPVYKNCTFGSLATARSWAVVRAAMLFTKALAAAGKVARDVQIEDCNFWINATNTGNRFIYGANATDIERVALFKNCNFIANGASSAIPAQNVAFWATLTVGSVLLKDCTSVNAGTAMSTTTWVFVDWSVPAAATTWISLQAS